MRTGRHPTQPPGGAALVRAGSWGGFARVPRVSTAQRYRVRNPSTGREMLIDAGPGEVYRDRDSGEELQVVGKVLPLAPSASRLPWAVENLRLCPWCDQLAQKDLNDCPTCGRRMGPMTPADSRR
jgi:hypothetical protein